MGDAGKAGDAGEGPAGPGSLEPQRSWKRGGGVSATVAGLASRRLGRRKATAKKQAQRQRQRQAESEATTDATTGADEADEADEGGEAESQVADSQATVDLHDWDEEAVKLFAAINVEPASRKDTLYRDLDPVWVDADTGGEVFVGNVDAAKSAAVLRAHNITHVVNCTDNLELYHEWNDEWPVAYNRFLIAAWMHRVGPSCRRRDVHIFMDPVIAFIDGALADGQSVLIHCLAGAHRAGTTGVMYVMLKAHLSYAQALRACKMQRVIIQPMGLLKRLALVWDDILRIEQASSEFLGGFTVTESGTNFEAEAEGEDEGDPEDREGDLDHDHDHDDLDEEGDTN